MRAALPIFVTHAKWKSFLTRDTRYLKERIGFIAACKRTDHWWHAASVGEIQTLWPLLAAGLQHSLKSDSDTRWLVTTNTTTGFEVLQQRIRQSGLEPYMKHAYCPIDSIPITRRFIRRAKPKNVVMMETEIWPNLYCALHQQAIPVTVINARATEKTLHTIRTGSPLATTFVPAYKAALSKVRILARSDEEAMRYELLGADASHISVVGDLKFADNRPAHCRSPFADNATLSNYVVAASTHEPEERQLAQQWLEQSDCGLLVIVPRHMERCNQLYKSLCARFPDQTIERRSTGGTPTAGSRLYLADSLGELHDWYCGARAVFVGGSLIERGGHNVLEPYFHGVAVVTGPHTSNFSDAVRWLSEREQITQSADAADVVRTLLQVCQTDQTVTPIGQQDCLSRYLALLGFAQA